MRTKPSNSLWMPLAAPAVWVLHFLASYITAAIACAKTAPQGDAFTNARIAIALYSLLALTAIAACARHGWRYRRDPRDQTQAAAAARRRFIGDVTLLLSGLSAVATIYIALPALFFSSCR